LLPSSIQGIVIAGVSFVACGPGAPGCAAILAGSITASAAYGNGASTSQALRAGVITGATAYAFTEVGDRFSGWANVAGHAAVGCASSVASGGSCQSGAMAGAVGSMFSQFGPKFNSFAANYVAHMVAGGLASVAGGGKFENGATTAAFGYLFTQVLSSLRAAAAGNAAAAAGGQVDPETGKETPVDKNKIYLLTLVDDSDSKKMSKEEIDDSVQKLIASGDIFVPRKGFVQKI
jgi:hypothetical protein